MAAAIAPVFTTAETRLTNAEREAKEAITILIGINGFKSAGKDTIGDYLVDKYSFKKASFAALLKQSAAALFDVPVEKWEEWKNDSQKVICIADLNDDEPTVMQTVREFLQRYGTESHRDVFGYDFWVEQAFKNLDPNKNIVFTDARFENELQAIHDLNGINIQVLREETDKESGGHASEIRPHQSMLDHAVDNRHDKEWLYDQIDDIMDGYEL